MDDDLPVIEKIRSRAVNFQAVRRTRACPSGKARHATKKRALGSRALYLKAGEADFLRVYKCPMCHDFHLTSQKQGKKKRA